MLLIDALASRQWSAMGGSMLGVLRTLSWPAIAVTAIGLATPAFDAMAEPDAPQAIVTDLWAVVGSDGTLARGKSAVSSAVLGTGRYKVKFTGNVTQCVYQATLGMPAAGKPPLGLISVAPLRGDSKALIVITRAQAGRPIAAGFHLFVTCPNLKPPGLKADDRWALVSDVASIVRTKGAVSAALLDSDTAYEVVFDKDVTQCAYLASRMDIDQYGPTILMGVARRALKPAGIYVRVKPGALPWLFSVVLKCPAGTSQSPAADTTKGDRWAVVNANGTLARGYGVISTSKWDDGRYTVRFTRGSLANWPPNANLITIGAAAPTLSVPTGIAFTGEPYVTRSFVEYNVPTRTGSGPPADKPFHLSVVGSR
jgi:hypothetical protein